MTLAFLAMSFVLSVSGVWIFRKLLAGSPRLLDIPNERSSHSVPVPRGAGLAIIFAVLATYIAAFGAELNVPYILAALIIAAVSLLDDLFSVPFWIRLAVHFLAAGAFVYSSGHYTHVSILSFGPLTFGAIGPWITVLFIVWTINAFNFMDGIDGIAGAQGVGAAFGWMLLGITAAATSHAELGAIVLGASAGFLLFNWPPAKVFMGDVGSTFLGFTFAAFPLVASPNASSNFGWDLALAVVLLWLFLFDTICTRVQLVARRRAFWEAHREHLYQRIVRSGRPHLAVSLFFAVYAIATAITLAFTPKLGIFPLTALLVAGPIFLVLWPRMSKSS
jgi:UDP-N-acetylmuramyl pentapeptide phosphotransferase/UDP-N-acetylglucosamine-1-phosphate transferase